MNDKYEKLGELIDSIDSIAHGLNMPLGAEVHVTMLKELLPENVKRLKEFFVEITGENPWE